MRSAEQRTLAPGRELADVESRDTVPASDADATLPAASTDSGAQDFADLAPVDAGNYVMGAVIARGGMGQIVYARDRRIGRPVAIKQIHEALLADLAPGMRRAVIARFKREAQVTARLQHPSIVAVYEAGELEGRPFFAMRLVEGEPLDQRISAASTLRERLALLPNLISVADALAYAHQNCIIHRDLKPANVIVGAFGDTVVIDWGLAKDLSERELRLDSEPPAVGSSGNQTQAGSVFGTPQYMPPEQARGQRVDERADVYSIGAILYHLLAGRRPYSGVVPGRESEPLIDAVLGSPPTPLSQLEPDAPSDLVSIVDKAMARQPGDRYRNAAELAADLRTFEAGQLVAVHNYKLRERLSRLLRKNLATVLTAAALLSVLIVFGAVTVSEIRQQRDRAETALLSEKATNRRAAQQLEKQGRAHLIAENYTLASHALVEAYGMGSQSDNLRLMLHDVMLAISPRYLVDVGPEWVREMCLSSDSRYAALASNDGLVRVVDIERGQLVTAIKAHDSDVTSVQISSDSRLLMTGSHEGETAVWEIETERQVASMRDGACQVQLAMFLEGRYPGSLVLSSDGIARVYDASWRARFELDIWAAGPAKLTGLRSCNYPIQSVLPNDDHTTVTVLAADGNHSVWDLGTGEVLSAGHRIVGLKSQATPLGIVGAAADVLLLRAHGDGDPRRQSVGFQISAVDVSPDGTSVAVGGDHGELLIIDFATGARRLRPAGHRAAVTSLDFSSDSAWLLTTGKDYAARLWDANTGASLATYAGHNDSVPMAIITPDQTAVVTLSTDQVLRIWSPRPENSRALFRSDIGILSSTFLAGDTQLLLHGEDAVSLRSVETGREIRSWPGGLHAFGASPDRAYAVIDSEIVDLRTTQTVATLEGVAEHGVGAAISRDNSRVCLSSLQSTVVFELSTGKRICVLEGRPLTMAAAFVGDTHRLVTLGADRTVQMWDGDTCELIARFGQHTAGIRSLDVTADGALIATTGRDGVRIWDTRERRQIARFETSVTAARFNRAGDRLITAGYGGLVKIWNPRAERPVQILRGHTARVMDAQFSRDGRRAVTVSSDATMRLWDVESGALLRARGTSQRLTRGTFGEDNNTLAFVASDVVEIWRLPLENRSPAQLRSRLAELASAGVAR